MTLKQLDDTWRNSLEGKTGQKLIKAVRTALLDGSMTTISLTAALGRYETELQPEVLAGFQKDGSLSAEGRSAVTLYGQLLAAEMLLLIDTHAYKTLRPKMLSFLDISSSVVKASYDFIGKAVDTLSYNFKSLGYDWSNVENATSLDILAFRICGKSVMDRTSLNRFELNGAGQACVSDGALQIRSSYGGTASSKAFGIAGDRVQVYTRSTRFDKLKSSHADEADSLREFARSFAETQSETGSAARSGAGNKLSVGDRVTVKILSHQDDSLLKCIALDSRDTAEGRIQDEELIKGTYTEDLAEYIYDDDCIEGAVVVEAGEEPVFSIKEAYAAFALQKAKSDERNSMVFEAKAVAVLDKIGRINWMTAGGYGAISLTIDGIKKGDIAVLTLQNIQRQTGRTFINVCEPRYGYEKIDREFDDEAVLLGFVKDARAAMGSIMGKAAKDPDSNAGRETSRSLARIIAHKVSSLDPVEAYRRLLCAEFLSRLTGDGEGTERYAAQAAYLCSCLEYAQNGTVAGLLHSRYLTDGQNLMLDILSLAGSPEKVSELSAKFLPGDLSSDANRVLSLLVALGASSEYEDEVKVSRDAVRGAICRILGVGGCFRPEGAVIMGKYGKGEGQKLEFKSSYVMRNDGKGPDIDYQGRGQVFEAVCAFLNSDGGTVYLGVNDRTGDPIISEDFGLRGDIRWLCENFTKIDVQRFRQLGYHVPKPDSLDHFVLFLNAEKELYFKKSLRGNIIIEATEDQDAIRISVSKSQYEIAYLYRDAKSGEDGQAFMRDGGRTVRMTSLAKEQRLMSLKSIKREMDFIVTLQEAIDRKHKVVLKDYASGNSGTIRDRFVVPVNLFYNDENVYCWDLEEAVFKQFRLSRIGSIDTDIEDPVYTHAFVPREADVFRWINEKESYHIKVRMDVGARNYLLEEYSNAKNLPASELYEDSNGKWILDTRLQGLGAMRRFFVGLADKMEILPTEDSEKLKADIRNYIGANLKEYMRL